MKMGWEERKGEGESQAGQEGEQRKEQPCRAAWSREESMRYR